MILFARNGTRLIAQGPAMVIVHKKKKENNREKTAEI